MFISESENTIRIQCTFTDTEDALTDIDDAEVRIYDKNKALIETIDTVTRVSEGVYYAEYTTPQSTKATNYFCSMRGTVDSKLVVKRGQFQTRFFVDEG